MKILCTGDLHIGRRSSQLPPDAVVAESSAAAAWERIVRLALAEEVDVVAMTGDIIDRANRFYEAIGALESGLRTLSGAGIEVVLVSGNHDHDILPLALESLDAPGIHLLGQGGEWERRTIERRGTRLHLDGWSFPAAWHEESPLASYALPADGTPTLALLHADLDQPRSVYAPVARAELRRHADVLFLLGHVHGSLHINEPGGARAVYPGSPQALDPGEGGAHGVYLLELISGGFEARFVPTSTVRYETLVVEVAGLETRNEVNVAIARAARELLVETAAHHPALRELRCRVRLTGESPLHSELGDSLAREAAGLEHSHGAARGSVARVDVVTSPPRDLRELAGGAGAAAVLAKLLLELESEEGGPHSDRLLADALTKAREVEQAPAYAAVIEDEPLPEAARREEVWEVVSRAASVLLDRLLAQKEVGS